VTKIGTWPGLFPLLYFCAPDDLAFRNVGSGERAFVTSPSIDLDAETLRRCLRFGGLEVSVERAPALLPVVAALLAGCDRLATLNLATPGGCAWDGGQRD
jgi:hypothetical protein